MDTTAALWSGTTILLSAGISYWVSKSQKKMEFRYDYRKYMLDKRKDAYNKIEKLIDSLNDIKLKSFNRENAELKMQELKAVVTTTETTIWTSAELKKKLNEIQTFFLNIIFVDIKKMVEGETREEKEVKASDFDWKKFETHTIQLSKLNQQLEEIYFQDLIRLNEIDKFIKKKLPKRK